MVGWHHQLHGPVFEQTRELVTGRRPGVLQSMGSQSRTRLSGYTELIPTSAPREKGACQAHLWGTMDWEARVAFDTHDLHGKYVSPQAHGFCFLRGLVGMTCMVNT